MLPREKGHTRGFRGTSSFGDGEPTCEAPDFVPVEEGWLKSRTGETPLTRNAREAKIRTPAKKRTSPSGPRRFLFALGGFGRMRAALTGGIGVTIGDSLQLGGNYILTLKRRSGSVTNFRNELLQVKLTAAEPSLASICKRLLTDRVLNAACRPLHVKLEYGPPFRGTPEADLAQAHRIVAVLVLLWFCGTALLVALNDIDFFSFEDLVDTAHPHHEHVVVALLVCGVAAAAVILRNGSRSRLPA